MDRKQKEKLRYLVQARKRADKVLAKRHEVERQKLDHQKRLQASQELKEKYTRELTELAQECGILAMAEQAALQRGSTLEQTVSYYLYSGLTSNSSMKTLADFERGELRASHLALRFTWEDAGMANEVEIRMHKQGYITFHNFFLPIFPIFWRFYSPLLRNLLASAMAHPRQSPMPENTGV